MNPRFRNLDTPDIEAFVRETLLAADRKTPVVAVTTSVTERRPWIDPEELALELGDRAEVVLIETGEATWALSAALPKRLDVFGGAVRTWWPGLSAESNPYDHPLQIIRSAEEAARAKERVRAAILESDTSAGRWGPWSAGAGSPGPSSTSPPRSRHEGRAFTETGAEPRVDSWQLIAAEYKVGDVVPGRVFRVEPRDVLVELLPGAGVVVPLAEIDFTWVRDPAELLTVGERVHVELLELDPGSRRGLASIKRALLRTPRAGIALRPGEPPYLGEESVEESALTLRRALRREQELARQQSLEIEAALEDRRQLARSDEELKAQLVLARKDLKSAEDRCRRLEQKVAADLDPLASETSFLAAVRVDYARRFDEGDRFRYPLARMRVGREFLESLRALEGLDPEKVVEVCAQVACGRAHEIAGRAVHELAEGATGKGIVRASDGAKAWRCALQVASPSARRLHWWIVPAESGHVVEFASVAVHDDFAIPR